MLEHQIERDNNMPCDQDGCPFWMPDLEAYCSAIGSDGDPAYASCPSYVPIQLEA